eukprot:g7620.t1
MASASRSSSATGVTTNALRIGRASANRVIFGHGLGDSPHGWADVCGLWSREISNVQFVLPAAPLRGVTLNGGAQMPAWYDIPTFETLANFDSRLDMDAEGIDEAGAMYSEHVVEPERTVFAGFSQGAGVALYTGICAAIVHNSKNRRSVPRGILAMSGYLPATKALMAMAASVRKDTLAKSRGGGVDGSNSCADAGGVSVSSEVARPDVLDLSSVPVLLCHGTADQMVSFDNALKTKNFLAEEFSIDAEVYEIAGMGHEACQEEIDHVKDWLRKRFPEGDEKWIAAAQ